MRLEDERIAQEAATAVEVGIEEEDLVATSGPTGASPSGDHVMVGAPSPVAAVVVDEVVAVQGYDEEDAVEAEEVDDDEPCSPPAATAEVEAAPTPEELAEARRRVVAKLTASPVRTNARVDRPSASASTLASSPLRPSPNKARTENYDGLATSDPVSPAPPAPSTPTSAGRGPETTSADNSPVAHSTPTNAGAGLSMPAPMPLVASSLDILPSSTAMPPAHPLQSLVVGSNSQSVEGHKSRIPRLRRHLSAALSADAAAVAVRSPMRKASHFGVGGARGVVGAGGAGGVGGGDDGQTAESASFLSAFLVAAGLEPVKAVRATAQLRNASMSSPQDLLDDPAAARKVLGKAGVRPQQWKNIERQMTYAIEAAKGKQRLGKGVGMGGGAGAGAPPGLSSTQQTDLGVTGELNKPSSRGEDGGEQSDPTGTEQQQAVAGASSGTHYPSGSPIRKRGRAVKMKARVDPTEYARKRAEKVRE